MSCCRGVDHTGQPGGQAKAGQHRHQAASNRVQACAKGPRLHASRRPAELHLKGGAAKRRVGVRLLRPISWYRAAVQQGTRAGKLAGARVYRVLAEAFSTYLCTLPADARFAQAIPSPPVCCSTQTQVTVLVSALQARQQAGQTADFLMKRLCERVASLRPGRVPAAT